MASSNRVEEKDKGFKKFFQRLRVLDGLEVVVGIPAAEGSAVREGGITLAEIGQHHEFGAPKANIPQRSFLRDTFDINEKKYGRLLDKAAKSTVQKKNSRAALFVLAQTARTDVIERISQGIPPPNAPATIARKGSDLPLVDKGIMRAAIQAVVRKETRD